MLSVAVLATVGLATTIRPKSAQHLCVTSQWAGGSEYSPLLLRDCVANDTFTWDGRLHLGSHTYGYAPSNGAYAELYTCTSRGTAWHRDAGTDQVSGENPSFCLDATGGRYQPETSVQIWSCHDVCHPDFGNQQWVFVE